MIAAIAIGVELSNTIRKALHYAHCRVALLKRKEMMIGS